MFRLLGVILMLVAGVALVLVLGFVFATIQSAVLSDTRSIGVLQAVGMTIAGIELMYAVQFALVSLVAVPLGLFGSYSRSSSCCRSCCNRWGRREPRLNWECRSF